MNASELMIGDWVHWQNRTIDPDIWLDSPIRELQGDHCHLEYGGGDPFDYDEIEPIPLTPEILEKNGFRLIGERFVFGEIDDALVELNLSINNSYRAKISVADLMISHNGWIKYIHELQHALRLCGIEKEIEL